MNLFMYQLSMIKDTVMQIAEAITAALEIETEIVDSKLQIIGGTGRYKEKIGSYEENGDLDSDYIYSKLLKNGHNYVCINPTADPLYDAKEGELAEIACPITIDGIVVGLIGLVAFTEEQKNKIINKSDTFTIFLQRMADLLASKLLLTYQSQSLKHRLDSFLMPTGSAMSDIIGNSTLLTNVKSRALQVSSTDSTILITGESGTGKEIFARAIHASSFRKDAPFVAINCGAIPEMLLESELFGYEKGAFTGALSQKLGKFEMADKGTLFLDEIGDMPLHLQVKLLRALQNRTIERVGGIHSIPIDVRIIAATNRDLDEMVKQKQFREDLYFRLSVIPLRIPPLRERPEDIQDMLVHALSKFCARFNKNILGFSENARKLLMGYSWPGNVRELENVVEYAVNMEMSSYVQPQNLPEKLQGYAKDYLSQTLKDQTDRFQKKLFIDYLETYGRSLDDKLKIAEILEISSSTFYRRLRELEIK